MYFKTFTKSQMAAIFLIGLMVQLSSAAPLLQNSGFENPSTTNPGGASNWYGYTFSSDGGAGSASTSTEPSAVATGSIGFALTAASASGEYSAAWVESNRYPLPGGSLELSFQFKNLPSTAPGVWSEYKITFFDSIGATTPLSTITKSTGYSWSGWARKTESNIAPPSGANFVSVAFYAYASGGSGGESQWAFDNAFLRSEATKTVLLDIGRSDADGGYYGGRTPASPDSNGNYWNTLDLGKYAGSMKDKTNGGTSWGAGFINTNSPWFGWYNGPAGDNNTNQAAWSINEAALGDLGNKDAAFDFVKGTNIRMTIDELTPGKKYRLNFYCSSKYTEGDLATTISVYSDNTFASPVKLDEGTVANRSATDSAAHNADTLLALDDLTPTKTSLYVNIVGASGGDGVLNALSIQELDTPTVAPVITSTSNGSGAVGQAFTYGITANYATSYDTTGLPTGLSVNPATGVISGNPTAAGNAVVNLIASNADRSATNAITLNIAKGTSTITTTGINTSTSTGSTGLVSYSYVGTGSTSYGPSPTEPTLPGDYEVTATVDADANWESATSSPFAFTVAQTDPLATWLAGNPTNSQTLGKYAIGGASSVSGSSEAPVMSSSSNTLSLTAIVRKASANTNLTVSAEWATSLNNASWSNQGVTSDTTGLTQPTDPELERRKFSVPYDPATEPRKFLRLKAVLTP